MDDKSANDYISKILSKLQIRVRPHEKATPDSDLSVVASAT
jgi:hypothetical protein